LWRGRHRLKLDGSPAGCDSAISSNTRRRSAHEQGNVQMGTGRDTGAGTSTDTCASMPETDTGALTTRPLRASRLPALCELEPISLGSDAGSISPTDGGWKLGERYGLLRNRLLSSPPIGKDVKAAPFSVTLPLATAEILTDPVSTPQQSALVSYQYQHQHQRHYQH